MVTNVGINARTLILNGLVSALKDRVLDINQLSENEIDLLIEEYGHGWPELLGLV